MTNCFYRKLNIFGPNS